MDKYRMEGHKLWWHLDRVESWVKGERIVPLHMDIGISKGCDIACVYCYGALQGRIGPSGFNIPKEPLLRFLRDAAELGVKAISITGEAEPTMNPAVYDAVVEGNRCGLSMGLATWGGRLGEERIPDLANNLVWIRFNISAGDENSYRKIHKTREDNFNKVVKNIEAFVKIRKQDNLPLTVGLQMVTMPWYAEEAKKLAKLGRDLGVDYLEIKHCSDNFQGDLGVKHDDYQKVVDQLKEAEEYATDTFDVVVRWSKILKGRERDYDVCYCAGNFMLRMSGNGTIYPCAQFFDWRSEEFAIGNIIEESFKDIFYSDRYLEAVKRIQNLNVHEECYSGCKENAINESLWMIKHPPLHTNFI
ncbi:MAG: radical SAM protein [Candidatus Scalindua sp.]|nr:radical SAM protein [Candidatus Scalindua sp.]